MNFTLEIPESDMRKLNREKYYVIQSYLRKVRREIVQRELLPDLSKALEDFATYGTCYLNVIC